MVFVSKNLLCAATLCQFCSRTDFVVIGDSDDNVDRGGQLSRADAEALTRVLLRLLNDPTRNCPNCVNYHASLGTLNKAGLIGRPSVIGTLPMQFTNFEVADSELPVELLLNALRCTNITFDPTGSLLGLVFYSPTFTETLGEMISKHTALVNGLNYINTTHEEKSKDAQNSGGKNKVQGKGGNTSQGPKGIQGRFGPN